ncbi:hypothetical protein B0H19DRAFT_1069122 [Mycena capillaripes]|nr:hypothetical protein B0H19DRAFT_1069122 [Mycena capillaripes]
MLSSILTLFSFSSKGLVGLFGGFCIGAQVSVSIVLSGLSVSKIHGSLLATRTTEIVLLPTKCVPSNGTASFPYVAAMGYATVVFASLFCILRAKGFITQPPSPPPDPSSSCSTNKDPRRNGWLWLLLLLFSLLAMLLVWTYAYFYLTSPEPPTPLLAFILGRVLSVAEACFHKGRIAIVAVVSNSTAYIATIRTYLALYSRQYSVLLLFAAASHSCFFFIYWGSSTLRSRIALCIYGCFNYHGAVFLGSICLLLFVSRLNWILWGIYTSGLYVESVFFHLLNNRGAFSCFSPTVNAWSSLTMEKRTMIVGPTILHFFFVILWTTYLALSECSPIRALKKLANTVYRRPGFATSFMWDCIEVTLVLASSTLPLVLMATAAEYSNNPNYSRLMGEYPFLSRDWWNSMQAAYRIYARRYRSWIDFDIIFWGDVGRSLLGTPGSCLEAWYALGNIPKMLRPSYIMVTISSQFGSADGDDSFPSSFTSRHDGEWTARISSQASTRSKHQDNGKLTSKNDGGTRAKLPVRP